MSNDWVLLFMLAAGLGGIVFVMRRFAGTPPQNNHAIEQLEEKLERVSRDMRFEISENLRGNRQEMSQSMAQFQQTLTEQLALMQTNLNAQLQTLGEGNTRRMAEVRETLDRQLQNLQETNIAKLEEMRKTVDEKLQTTLEKRLSESFKQVAERLEQVHQGLGQMQTLAQGVGDLQKVLSNVKTRGIFGEVQLQALLDQVLTIEQYGKQVETKPRSNQRVDFAIKLPGRSDDGARVKTTNVCSKRKTVRMRRGQKAPPKPWKRAFDWKPKPLQKVTWPRRTPPTLQFCFYRLKVCMQRYCAAPV